MGEIKYPVKTRFGFSPPVWLPPCVYDPSRACGQAQYANASKTGCQNCGFHCQHKNRKSWKNQGVGATEAHKLYFVLLFLICCSRPSRARDAALLGIVTMLRLILASILLLYFENCNGISSVL